MLLDDILEAIELIHTYMKNVSEDSFSVNPEKQYDVLRRIQIIGEAVKKISDKTRKVHSDVPWREIAGMRDIVVHDYGGVTLPLIYRVVTTDIFALEKQIRKIRQEIST
ncbi:MAG: DUF86 domain-containing protein [Cyclobacteriaceae bacterium]